MVRVACLCVRVLCFSFWVPCFVFSVISVFVLFARVLFSIFFFGL